MATAEEIAKIDEVQGAYRRQIAQSWNLGEGSKILEIGCGQGDMTVALAEAVGATGRVVAIDPAASDYGSPQTLGEATDLIKSSDLGTRIDFQLEFDVLTESTNWEDEFFDWAVLAHSSWYFASRDQLLQTLRKIKPWAKNLGFAEWDPTPASFDQVGHMLAVLIQGQVEAFKSSSQANIRSPLSRQQVKEVLADAGWEVDGESDLDTSEMQDGKWEIDACERFALADAAALALPKKYMSLLNDQLAILNQLKTKHGARALPAYSLTATRNPQVQ